MPLGGVYMPESSPNHQFSTYIARKPVPKQRARTFRDPRSGRVISKTPAKTAQEEQHIRHRVAADMAIARLPHAPKLPAHVDLEFKMPTKKSDRWGLPHTFRPDLDNLMKLAMDALNGICWEDDACVYSVSASKVWAEEAGITISIRWDAPEEEANGTPTASTAAAR